MATGDVYYLRDAQTFLGQQVLNTYWYQVVSDDSGGNAQALVDEYIADVLPFIRAFQSEDLLHVEIQAFLWANPSGNAYTDSTIREGDREGAPNMPSYVAASFRSPKGDPGTRYSYKRYAGIDETLTDGNETSGTAIYSDLGAPLGAALTGSGGGVFNPVQVARQIGGVDVLPPLGTGSPVVNRLLLGTWTAQLNLTTQRTRKIGVGS